MQYVLSPLAKITRLDSEGRPVLHAGSGTDRCHLALEGPAAQPLIEWLLGCRAPEPLDAIGKALRGATGLDDADATELIENMVGLQVLIPAGDLDGQPAHLARWGRYGWRDAADFHLATHGLRFVPDETGDVSYDDHFGAMLEDTETVGEQPPAYVPPGGERLPIREAEPAAASLDEVLSRTRPINRFEGPAVSGAELLPALRAAFGTQRVIGGVLGEHHMRSYPSGGARHPFEMYLVSKGLADVPSGVYRFDTLEHTLAGVPQHGEPAAVDVACFGKGGIRTAGAVLVLTCRWLRHSWKYRYARSYRMLLLEAGHIVQAVHLTMLRYGIDVYHCPSINDSTLQEILALDDDCAEGAAYAFGLGYGGVR